MSKPEKRLPFNISPEASAYPELLEMQVILRKHGAADELERFKTYALEILWINAGEEPRKLIRDYFKELMAPYQKKTEFWIFAHNSKESYKPAYPGIYRSYEYPIGARDTFLQAFEVVEKIVKVFKPKTTTYTIVEAIR